MHLRPSPSLSLQRQFGFGERKSDFHPLQGNLSHCSGPRCQADCMYRSRMLTQSQPAHFMSLQSPRYSLGFTKHGYIYDEGCSSNNTPMPQHWKSTSCSGPSYCPTRGQHVAIRAFSITHCHVCSLIAHQRRCHAAPLPKLRESLQNQQADNPMALSASHLLLDQIVASTV